LTDSRVTRNLTYRCKACASSSSADHRRHLRAAGALGPARRSSRSKRPQAISAAILRRADRGHCGLFLTSNRNKKSVVSISRRTRGRAVLRPRARLRRRRRQLRPGVLRRLKIDFETLRTINPASSSARVTGFGTAGEYKDYPRSTSSIRRSAEMAITGERGRHGARGHTAADLSGGILQA